MGNALDWAMTIMEGDGVAHGVYLYVITAWDCHGQLLESQVDKLALVPGGVGLGQAPPLVSGSERTLTSERRGTSAVPLAYSVTDWVCVRVPVKVTVENGPIKVGDFLITSS